MKKSVYLLIIFLLLLFPICSFPDSGPSPAEKETEDTRGVYEEVMEEEAREKKNHIFPPPLRMNRLEAFKSVKPNNMAAFLVGNNDYAPESGFVSLNECANDVNLLSHILTVCCKLDRKNIHTGINMTAGEFKSGIKKIISRLENDQSLFLSFSGHGDEDGSLIFVDGSSVTPGELKSIVNSFSNDTVILIDACHSGGHDLPVDLTESVQFKENSIRIYSSLAHMNSKEIQYTNDYFAYLNDFYKKVLGLPGLEGNGYFISFIGYFFAEFDFSDSENISYLDLMNYIANKNNQYVEDLARRGYRSRDAEAEFVKRQYQVPKMYPLGTKNRLKDPNHQFILIYKPIQPPLGIHVDVAIESNYTFTEVFAGRLGAGLSLGLTYVPGIEKGFFFGIETGYFFVNRPEEIKSGEQSIRGHFIPVMVTGGFRNYLFNDQLIFTLTGGGGVCAGIWYTEKFLTVDAEIKNYIHGYFKGEVSLSYPLRENIRLKFGIQAYDIMLDLSHHIIGLKLPVFFNYRF